MTNLVVVFAVLVASALGQAAVQLERLNMNITCPNGSVFILQHDPHDTRVSLSTPSLTTPSHNSYTMIAHSRDNQLLRVDIIRWGADGRAAEHYDVSDFKQHMVNEATAAVLAGLESSAPDIFFVMQEVRREGLKRTTRVRRQLPEAIRKLLPVLPTVYERLIYSALSPHFGKIMQRIPKSFELFPKIEVRSAVKHARDGKQRHGAAEKKSVTRAFQFDFQGHDQFGRPAAVQRLG